MGIWKNIRNWIFGFNYIDKEAFDKKMDELSASIAVEIGKIKDSIDSDKDGMVSVGETYGLIKVTFKLFLKMVKSWF